MATAFINIEAHPAAWIYYPSAPEEPIVPKDALSLATFVKLPSKVTGDSLLATIEANAKHGDDILIVSHGNDRGLAMRLVPPHNAKDKLGSLLNVDTIPVLLDDKIAESEATKILLITVSELRRLRRRIKAVQAKQLGRVEFRACNIGKSKEALTALRNVFGAASAGAPMVDDSYVAVPSPVMSGVDTWIKKQHPSAKVEIESGGKRVAYFAQDPGAGTTAWQHIKWEWAAESGAALEEWTAAHFPAAKGKLAALHGFVMSDPGTGVPTNKSWRFVFPGDSEFSSLLVSV